MNDDTRPTYDYNGIQLDREDLLKSLDKNWYSYSKFMGWSADKAKAAFDSYQNYRQAIMEDRLSSDARHAIHDSAELLSTGDLTYYNSSGKPLSVTQKDKEKHTKESVVLNNVEDSGKRTDMYNNAKKKDVKYSNSFDANFEAASFVDIVAGKMAEEYQKIWDKELADKKAADEKAAKEKEAADKKAAKEKEEADKKAAEEAAKKVIFDPATHGFWAQFKNGVTGGSGTFDWDTILDLDPYNEESSSRPTSARAMKLANYINTYIDWLNKTKNWDFSKMGANYPNVESYITALHDLYNDLTTEEIGEDGNKRRVGALIDSSDLSRLAALGATPDEYKQYFTTEKAYTPKTSSAASSGSSAKDISDELVNEWYNWYQNQHYTTDPDTGNSVQENTIKSIPENGKKDIRFTKNGNGVDVLISEDEFPTALNKKVNELNRDDSRTSISMPDLSFDENSDGTDWPEFIRGYYEVYGQKQPQLFQKLNYYGPYDGWICMPSTYNENNFTMLIFNPDNGDIGRVFVGFLGQDWVDKVLSDLKKKIANTPAANRTVPKTVVESHALGGELIRKLQAGGNPTSDLDAAVSAAKAAQQKVNAAAKTTLTEYANSPSAHRVNEGLTATDYVRLAGAAADLFAVLYPGVIGSFVAGLGSTFLNLGADIADKESVGKTLSSFGVNLGLSTVGAIPIAGQVLGSGTKLAKVLIKYTPKIVGAIAGIGMVGEIPNIINSYKKIGTGEATTDDLRNILLGIQIALGGATALRRAVGIHAVRVRGQNLSNGSVEVPVQVKNADGTLTHTYMTVPESEAGAIRAAKESQNIESLQKEVKRLSDGKYALDVTGQHETQGRRDFNLLKPGTWKKEMTGFEYDFDFNRILETNPEAIADSYKDLSSLSVRKQVANRAVKQSPTIDRENTLKIHPGSPIQDMSEQELIDAATKFYNDHKSTITSPDVTQKHSDFFNEILRRNESYSTKDLVDLGMYGAGGHLSRARRVLKGKEGVDTGKVLKAEEGDPIWGVTYINTPYENRSTEYKGNPSSKLMGEKHKTNTGHKDTPIAPYITEETWNPNDLAFGTTTARNTIWGGDDKGNAVRVADWANWAQNAYKEGMTLEELLQAYNSAYAKLSDFRWNHPDDAEWYTNSDEIANFNRTHKALYATANSDKYLGYDPRQDSWYGSTSSVRPLDITDEDVDVDVLAALTGSNGEALKKLLEGYTLRKAKNGAYYAVKNTAATEVQKNTEETVIEGGKNGSESEVRGDTVHVTPGTSDTNTKYFNIIPDVLDLTRLGIGLNVNTRLNKLAHKSPVNLEFPKERYRWLTGDLNSIQNGRAAYAELMHRMANPITSDASQQTAFMLEGNHQGQSYVNQGYQLNDTAFQKSREANWTQMGLNQDSRYNTAITNLGRLNDKRVSDLSADMGKIRSNYESWNNFLSGIQNKAEEFRTEALDYNKTVMKNNIKNAIYSDPAKYGIQISDADLKLLNEYKAGTKRYENMTDAEQATIDRFTAAIEEAVAIEFGKQYYGVRGNIYRPRTQTSVSDQISNVSTENVAANPGLTKEERWGGIITLIDSFAKGGKTGSDSVTIQKMRGRIQKMQTFQKHLEARMNALEKDMDRLQRGSVYYSKGQRSK